MLLIKKQATRNKKQDKIVNRNALLAEIIPDGISRIAVRGFLASKFLSKYRLKAIAALRAVTIQIITNKNLYPYLKYHGLLLSNASLFIIPNAKPIIANGNAKIVWENFTRLKYFLIADI